DPERPAVPEEPDGRLPRPVLRLVRQVGIERAREELLQVEDRPIARGDHRLDDCHRPSLSPSPSSPCGAWKWGSDSHRAGAGSAAPAGATFPPSRIAKNPYDLSSSRNVPAMAPLPSVQRYPSKSPWARGNLTDRTTRFGT